VGDDTDTTAQQILEHSRDLPYQRLTEDKKKNTTHCVLFKCARRNVHHNGVHQHKQQVRRIF
jgi:hypothetical protein